MKQKHLYLLTTAGLGDYYVLATNPSEAEESLVKILNEQDYGFRDERRVVNIAILTSSFYPNYANKSKPNLTDKSSRLLIVGDWGSGIVDILDNLKP
jgi:hypothetical protein